MRTRNTSNNGIVPVRATMSGGTMSGVMTSPLVGSVGAVGNYYKLDMEICLPNQGGLTQPTGSVAPSTINGSNPTQADIGRRIKYTGQGGNSNLVYKITGVSLISPIVGAATTDFEYTNWPCGGGGTTPKTITLKFCLNSVYGNSNQVSDCATVFGTLYQIYGKVDGSTPTQNDLGKTVLFNGCPAKIINVQPYTGNTNSTILYLNTISPNACVGQTPITPISIYGCTDPQATNFNPQAEVDNGSCTYSPRPTPTNPTLESRKRPDIRKSKRGPIDKYEHEFGFDGGLSERNTRARYRKPFEG